MATLFRRFMLVSIILISHSAFAIDLCRVVVKNRPSLDSLFETREVFDQNWKAWLAEKVDRGDPSVSKYIPEDRNLSRWQLINKRMSTELKEILLLARPEFFKDQVLPTPMELTKALILLYRKKSIPRSDWILPGLILQSSTQPNEFKDFTYLQVSKEWPSGFQIPDGSIPDTAINRALLNGVMPLHFKTEIPKFKVHMVYHDLNHMGSFLNKEYLSIFRYFYKIVYNKIDTNPWAKSNEAYYFGAHVGYDFIEEFWRVPVQKADQLNVLLNVFRNKNGQSFEDVKLINIRDYQYGLILNRQLIQNFNEIDARVKSLKYKVHVAGKSEYTPVGEWPVELQLVRTQIIQDFTVIAEPILKIVDRIQHFYEYEIQRVGAAVSDQMSFRSPLYSVTIDYNKNLRSLRYSLSEDFARLLKVDWDRVDRDFAGLLQPLIRGIQITPEEIKRSLEDNVNRN